MADSNSGDSEEELNYDDYEEDEKEFIIQLLELKNIDFDKSNESKTIESINLILNILDHGKHDYKSINDGVINEILNNLKYYMSNAIANSYVKRDKCKSLDVLLGQYGYYLFLFYYVLFKNIYEFIIFYGKKKTEWNNYVNYFNDLLSFINICINLPDLKTLENYETKLLFLSHGLLLFRSVISTSLEELQELMQEIGFDKSLIDDNMNYLIEYSFVYNFHLDIFINEENQDQDREIPLLKKYLFTEDIKTKYYDYINNPKKTKEILKKYGIIEKETKTQDDKKDHEVKNDDKKYSLYKSISKMIILTQSLNLNIEKNNEMKNILYDYYSMMFNNVYTDNYKDENIYYPHDLIGSIGLPISYDYNIDLLTEK